MKVARKCLFVFYLTMIICKATLAQENNILFEIKPSNLYQGNSFVLDVKSSIPLSNLKGSFYGQKTVFYKLPDKEKTYRSWVAVPIEAVPGKKVFYLEAIDNNGNVLRSRKILKIIKKNFPVQRIKLPKRQVSLLTSKALEKEAAIIGSCFKRISKKKYFDGKFLMPANGEITSDFGLKRVYIGSKASWHHKGLDIDGYIGKKIIASNNGKVILSMSMKAHGETIIVDHGLRVLSIYCHLKKRNVSKGEMIKKGDLIGLMGKSGIATGAHLHFGVSVNNIRVNPLQWIKGI